MKQQIQDNQVIHLLWTGGWDSTFRLISLMLEKGKKVQPYYVIDSDRRSTGLELRAMKNIKQFLFSKYPETRKSLLPTRFKEMNDIRTYREITESYDRLRMQFPLGSQYEWLARFAVEEKITNLEMCAINRPGPLHTLFEELLVSKGNSEDYSFYVDKKYKGSDAYNIFKDFSFPTFKMRKVDMQRISKEQGYFELMKITAFCHRPRINGKPCGVCNPCIIAMEEGLGWRLPFLSRARYYIQLLVNKGSQMLQKRLPILYGLAQKAKHRMVGVD